MIANVINDALFGFRYTHSECQPLMDFVNGFSKMMEKMTKNKGLLIALVFPKIRHVPWIGWHCVGRVKEAQDKLMEYIVNNVDKCISEYNVEDEPTCFVHAYKQRMDSNEYL
ncbi:hypothetical protein PRIPAC_80101, partial [Pristionchus pacificus]